MTINPETLKALRGNLSQEAVAERTGGAVSKRQISRIEAGHTRPEKVRARTVEGLARALNTTVEKLGAPLGDESESKRFNARPAKVWVEAETQFYIDSIDHLYGVPFDDLVHAAPWMFVLLAEMSLAHRRRSLDEGRVAFERAVDQLPAHLDRKALRAEFERVCAAELAAISQRELFGTRLLGEPASNDLKAQDCPNPFGEFVALLARSSTPDDFPADHALWGHSPGSLPDWGLFLVWCSRLGGNDSDACVALLEGDARIGDIPKELMAEDRSADRAAWLVSRLPRNSKHERSEAEGAEIISLDQHQFLRSLKNE